MNRTIQLNTTGRSIVVFIRGSATSPAGMALTGLLYNTAGLSFRYTRLNAAGQPIAAPVAITLATLASVIAAWSSGGFIELDGTNAKGEYRLDLPDAAIASGASAVIISWQGANTVEDAVLIELPNYDPVAAPTAPPTAAEIRTEMDSNSTDLNTIITNLATIAGYLDTEIAAILAAVDTEVAAIKAKTDSLTFTNAGKVDAAVLTAADFAAAVSAAIADKLLGRSIAGGADGGRTVTSALRKVRNKVSLSGGTGTVYAEDDATTDHTFAYTGTPSVTVVDP